jgi:hypothetical protein
LVVEVLLPLQVYFAAEYHMESSEGDPCKQNMMDDRFDKMDTKWLHSGIFSFYHDLFPCFCVTK